MILILNKTPLKHARYQDCLSDTKKNVILFSDSKAVESDAERLEIESCFHTVKWFENWGTNALVEVTALKTIEQNKINRIISPSEVDVIRSARLREKLKDNPESDLEKKMFCLRHKIAMRNLADLAQIKQPLFYPIQSLKELFVAVSNLGYPMVLKPVLSGGSIDVVKINTHEELQEFIATKAMPSFDQWSELIAEKYIPDNMIHTDGIVKNGKLLYSITSEYFNFCIDAFAGKDHASIPLPINNAIHALAEKQIVKLLNCLDCKSNFVFHAEFFVKENDLVFCEIAARPAGGRIREAIKHTTQWFDIFKTHVELQANIFNENLLQNKKLTNNRVGWFVTPPRKGVIKKFNITNLPEGVFSLETKHKLGDFLNNACHSGDELVSVLFNVNDDSNSQVETIRNWVSTNIEVNNI